MKNKKIVKVFATTLCLTFIFSTVAIAKENNKYKCAKASVYSVYPHPSEVEIPD